MTTINSAGIGSGLDVNSIITQLMSIERAPLQRLQTDQKDIQNKLSVYGRLQGLVSTMRDAALKLTKADTWGAVTASSGDSSVFSATAGTTATAGNYSLTVQQLASSQSIASAAWPATTSVVGSGTLRIELGSWGANQASFTANPDKTAVNVTVAPTDTLAEVRDKINAAKAGVMATIVTDASGSRLVMSSSETGEKNAFRVSATDDDGNNTDAAGLSSLAFDPSSGATSMSQTQAAANALATVNGLSVSSASNTLSTVLQGVTLTLNKTSNTPVSLTVATDATSIQKSITDFAAAYNSLNSYLADQTKYDAGTKTAGLLQGDSSTNALRSAMRQIAGGSGMAGGAFTRLAQVGLQPQADGSLLVDNAKLTAATANLTDLKTLFANKDLVDPKKNGFATSLQTWGDSILKFDGAITTRSDSFKRQIDANNNAQDAFNNRLTGIEARMRAQYTALDSKMAQMTALSSYVSQQFAYKSS
jgi:flagellar hook-associated protein 2